MRANQATYPAVVLQVIMAAEVGSIDDQTVVTDVTVVADVRVNHKHSVAADVGFVAELVGTTVDSSADAKNISLAYADLGDGLTVIAEVLGRSANDHVGKELVVGADDNIINYGNAIVQNTTRTDLNLRSNDTKRPNGGIVGYLGGGINAGKRMDFRHFPGFPKYCGY